MNRFVEDGDVIVLDADQDYRPPTIAELRATLRAAGFEEELHPRDERGRFGPKGRDELPEGWQRATEQEAIDHHAALLSEKLPDKDMGLLREVARKFRPDDVYAEYQGPGRMLVTFTGDVPATEVQQRELLLAATDLQERFPRERMTIRVDDRAFDQQSLKSEQLEGEQRSLGKTVPGNVTINLSPRLFTEPGAIESVERGGQIGGNMPSAAEDPLKYIVAHEWGHTLDRQTESFTGLHSGDAVADVVAEGFSPSSTYGTTALHEAYAEAFAEWAVTEGETDDEFTRHLAAAERWAA